MFKKYLTRILMSNDLDIIHRVRLGMPGKAIIDVPLHAARLMSSNSSPV